ncbi:MAG: CCA tRNA nucleotidyltransferase [Anaerovoracaceae bacterium]|nr:CCA tRNA nucleotidyltransferase [Bacillota bacterium]MDY2670578.1 CCA tRNA nucleotidyltransferase [Anaerovoracaceae bacterium]
MKDIILPDYILDIMGRLKKAGSAAYIVGGAVRDSLEGIIPDDYDMCTPSLPEETEQILSGMKIIETGLKHGTVTVITEGHEVEITTFRSDGAYSDGRHPDEVTFVKKLEEDLARRDFTVNAMAYSPDTGLVDVFKGQRDLEDGILRSVGDPVKRFSEDGLRIMRALRFMSVKGYQPDQTTDEAIRRCRQMLDKVAYERIDAELLKFLAGERAAKLLDSYRNIFAEIIPEIRPMFGFDQKSPYHNRDVWHHTLAALDAIRPDPVLRLTMLLHDMAKPVVYTEDETGRGHFKGHQAKGAEMAGEILRRMKFSKEIINTVTELIKDHDMKLQPVKPLVRGALVKLGPERLSMLLEIQEADSAGKREKYTAATKERVAQVRSMVKEIIADGDCISLKGLAVNGDDLKAAGVTDGKMIGKALSDLLEEVINDRLPNERQALLRAAEKYRG